MSKVLAVLLLSMMSIALYGQNQKIDSLQTLAQKIKVDTTLIKINGLLSQEYIKIGDSSQAFRHAYRSLGLAATTDDIYYKAGAYSDVGFSHLALLHIDSVKYYYFKTLEILENDTSFKAKDLKIIANNNIAYAYSIDGNMKKALSLIIANLPLVRELGDTAKYKSTIHNISAAFTSSGEYDKAYPYMKEDVLFADQGNFSEESKAETYMSAALLMFRMDSLQHTATLLDKSHKELKKIGAHVLWGRYHCLHARYLAKVGKIPEARKSLNKAWIEVKSTQNGTNDYDFYVAEMDVEWYSGNLMKARESAFKIYEIDKSSQNHAMMLPISKDIANLSNRMGDYKTAFQYIEIYSTLKDSIDHKQSLMDMNEMELQYRTSEKEKQISQLEAEKKETKLAQKNQRLLQWLFGVSAAIFLLAFIFVIYIHRSRQFQTALKLDELEKQKQLDLAQAVLESEERERQRIARDLHDGLGGALSGIKIKLSREQKQATTPVIDETILQLEDSIDELRRISRNMMPETLIRSGLEVAVRDLCVSLSSEKYLIEFQPSGIQKDISVQCQVNIYRIIQELLSNAIRHGQASQIIVQCIQQEHNCLITVEDNGIGYNIDQQPSSKGIGLINIRNRIDLMKGKIQVDSAINSGTTVNIELYI